MSKLKKNLEASSKKVLENFRLATRILFSIGVIGQLFFVVYIVVLYGGSAILVPTKKSMNELVHGMIEGDAMGNLAFWTHVFLAAVITIGGPIQFINRIRIQTRLSIGGMDEFIT